ncbi:MAG: MerR family transcriptional regulator [Gemmatimonadetes bacterium]|nr:MerR family transcriptional regulator [Gemmatimonadota bacterium]
MTIAQLAAETGVSKHTLRYYEQLGLVPLVDRDRSSGHRRYTAQHAGWIRFLRDLRATGMPIREVRAYARLVARGPDSWPERKRLLAAHRARVMGAITELQRHRRMLDRKLAAGCAPEGLGNAAD